MQVNLLKSKILRAEVTDCSLHYEGSLAIDSELMEQVNLLPYEKILVGNINTGKRFETYAIPAPAGSKTIALNGAAARLGTIEDLLVIMAFVQLDEKEAHEWKPKVLVLDEKNQKIVRSQNLSIPTNRHYKLFIPGPIEVSPKTYKAIATPVFGHRSSDFVDLYQSLQPGLQRLFYTQNPIFISTSSAWGVMEGCIRNLVGKRVLNCMSGAFSDKWFDVSQRCGKPASPLKFEWGEPVDPEAIRRELATNQYDALTLVHNETSTGTMNPLTEIMEVVREFPDVISIVDCVSSFSAVPVEMDVLGIDILLTGSQKALALPPGMALFSTSKRALDRADTTPNRGYYFDFMEFLKNHEKGMTPSTPVLPLIFGLRSILEDIDNEGLNNRYARHTHLNQKVHQWVEKHGLRLLPDPKYASKTLSCIRNTLNLDIAALNAALKDRFNCVIDGGYGKLKGTTFRISNMGDETDATIDQLLTHLDILIDEFKPKS